MVSRPWIDLYKVARPFLGGLSGNIAWSFVSSFDGYVRC